MGSVTIMRATAKHGSVHSHAPRSAITAMQTEVLEAIATGQRLDRVAALICRWIGRLAPRAICTIMMTDAAGLLQLVAAPDLPGVLHALASDIAIGPDASTCGRAAHHGVSAQSADIALDPGWETLRSLPLSLGLRACWSNPIHGQSGRVLGTFALYFRTRRGPSRFEVSIVNETIRLCALAMEHEAVLVRLEQANRRLDAALGNVCHGVCLFDGDNRLVMANNRYAEVYGLTPEQIHPGMTLPEVIALRLAAGSGPTQSSSDYFKWRMAVQADNQPSDSLVELAGGRFIAIHHRPMPDGGWVSTHEDVTERRMAEARVVHLATHDPLTDLPNRNVFRDRLDQALAQRSHRHICAVICIDLDRFKAVNDTYGHPVGDTLLLAVAQRLRSCVRAVDTVTRMGGDEFAILMPSIDQTDRAAQLARRIVERIGKPFDLRGHRMHIGASVGIATAPQNGTGADDLLKHADVALYRSKSEGGGTWHFYSPDFGPGHPVMPTAR